MRKSLYILGDLAEKDVVFLSKAGTLRDLAKDEVLVQEGTVPDALFFLTRGEFSVTTPDGHEVARLGVGDVVGEMSFVENRPPEADVTATEPSRVLAVPRAALDDALKDNPAFAGRFYKALATFLSDRLRTLTAELRGDGADTSILDERLLDIVHVAGNRMNRLIEMLEGRDGS